MRFFFRSRQFKIILTTLLVVLAVGVILVVIGGKMSPQADIIGSITAPFRAAWTQISTSVSTFAEALSGGTEAELHNAELEAELTDLRDKLAQYEEAKAENEFYKNYLEIKDQNPDFKMTKANLISRDALDPFKGFTINKGSADGISENDPVITHEGLVGFVSSVGRNTSKVVTVFSPDITMGALDNRTEDSGLISGTLETAEKGMTRFYNLSRSCSIAVGDYVVTSGQGIFPEGILVGTIRSVGSDQYNTSIFAEIEPFVDIQEVKSVMVITNFEGQGGLTVE